MYSFLFTVSKLYANDTMTVSTICFTTKLQCLCGISYLLFEKELRGILKIALLLRRREGKASPTRYQV